MGMTILKKRQDALVDDEATKNLLRQGVYRVEVRDPELGRFRTKVPYSLWSSIKYIFILSVLLFWLPTFGQMIAGYVGGRRAGAGWKAVLAAILPVAIIFSASYIYENGYLPAQFAIIYSLPSLIAKTIAEQIPFTAPYIQFSSEYFANFIFALKSTISMGLNGYLVTIVFAYIGGIVAEQYRREMEFRRPSPIGVSISHPLPISQTPQPMPASWYARHPEHLDRLHKIPVAGVIPSQPPSREKEIQKVQPAEIEKEVKEEKKEPRYSKKALSERLVRRALRQYDRRQS